MTHQLTQARRVALREFLESSPARLEESAAGEDRVAIAAVRQALDLPPIPYSRFLSADCWIAGGSLLRWLRAENAATHAHKGDFDFFFPSLEALNATACAMLAQGFRLRGYRALVRTIREYLRGTLVEDMHSGIYNESGRLVALTPQVVQQLRLSYLEFSSPEGDKVQLVAFRRPTPLDTIIEFDLSICQLVADDRYLTLGPWTRHDLRCNRFRAVKIRWPASTFRRMFRYARRGFWPYSTTLLRVSYSLLVFLLETLPPYLFRLCAPSSIQRRSQ